MIKFEKVSYTYFNKFYTLFEFDYQFNEGNYALIGDYDSGGLTLIRLLAKLDTWYKGNILINGKELKKTDYKKEFNVGYLSTRPTFFMNKTALDNVVYPLKSRRVKKNERINLGLSALKNFNLQDFANIKVKNLTYSQQLLLSLARVSVRKLDLLLVEDIFTTISFDLIKNLAPTTIVVTQNDIAPNNYTKLYFKLGNLENKDK